MILIASAANDWGIGKDNALLFRVSADMRFFRRLTTGNIVVMGRNTLLSMPGARPLPNRENIVLSRDPSFAPDGVTMARDVPELLSLVRETGGREVYVIGGAAVYETLLPYCDKAYITRFYAQKDADRYLPDLSASPDWELYARSPLYAQDDLYYTFDTYIRKGDALS